MAHKWGHGLQIEKHWAEVNFGPCTETRNAFIVLETLSFQLFRMRAEYSNFFGGNKVRTPPFNPEPNAALEFAT